MILIDGTFGEGGGQILRTSLALSLVTGKPFRINNIRAGRRKPGLGSQHLTAANAAAAIGHARISGNQAGSSVLEFHPETIASGEFRFQIGTAGSTSLVLQTILPALLTANKSSTIILEGGTHNPSAPPFEFLDLAFVPLLNRMGPQVQLSLKRPGFYPRGHGRVEAVIRPAARLEPFSLCERGKMLRQWARATVVNLPRHIGERELQVLRETLALPAAACQLVEMKGGVGQGNILTLVIESEHVTEVISGIGAPGLPAEEVAAGVAREARAYFDSHFPVGRHLADQILLPLALAGKGSFFTGPLSSHARTNIEVIKKFLPLDMRLTQRHGGCEILFSA